MRAGISSAPLGNLPPEHRVGTQRFLGRLEAACAKGSISDACAKIVARHVVRLAERGRNPSNTGNIEDLFFFTLASTGDPSRAYAQALADSVKVVPLSPDAKLLPTLRSLDGHRRYETVGQLDHLGPGDRMLVAHTMVAFGDEEMWASAVEFAMADTGCGPSEAERRAYRMAVHSQHHPSSAFVLARVRGLTIDCASIYPAAGYDAETTAWAQRFYDVCAEYRPDWTKCFLRGAIPSEREWSKWRSRYHEARAHLVPELRYQLSSDTLTNFLDGTLESGKWTDACVFFGGVERAQDVPAYVAGIVNQYLAELVALHDRPVQELIDACGEALARWGIGFSKGRAVVIDLTPEKRELLDEQFGQSIQRLHESRRRSA